MQKKGYKIDLNLLEDLKTKYETISDSLWRIMGGVSGNQQKVDAEILKLKSLDLKSILSDISEIEKASEQIGIPASPEVLKMKSSVVSLQSSQDKTVSKMIASSNDIQDTIGAFANKWK
jgi:hypothetical protein